MPGAWELEQPEVLVGILTRGLVNMSWSLSFRSLKLPQSAEIMPVAGMPYDHARNVIVEKAIAGGFERVLFLDDDVIPHEDSYFRLKQHNKDIISGVYYRRNEPFNICALRYNEDKTKINHLTEYRLNELIEVDFVGAGCLLIKTDVFRNLKEPWFEWRADRKDLPALERFSEDFYFCEYARKEGYKINVDTGLQCLHLGHSQISVNGFQSSTF